MILAGMGIGGSLGAWLADLLDDLFRSYQLAFEISMLSFTPSALAFVIAALQQRIALKTV